jgi:hypothetical protein
MKTVKFIFIFIVFLNIPSGLFSQDSQKFRKMELSSKVNSINSGISNNEDLNGKISSVNPKKDESKSPYLGALFSGIIPGTGEFYAKSYIKAAIFIGIEAGLWTAYSIYQSEGNSQTDSYQNYADQNWDVYKYAGWLKAQNFSGSEGIDLTSDKYTLRKQVNVVEAQNFSHQLPPYGEQQYYELIGKYQNFVVGWEDADLNYVNRNNYGTYKTDMFVGYSYDRQAANDYYNKANTTLTLVILNHILSSADAAWTVSMFNKDIKLKTSVHMENMYSFYGEKKLIPVGCLNVTF